MQKPERLERLEAAIAEAAGVTVEEINSDLREQTVADARAAVWFVARVCFRYSCPQLGKMYNRDHSTVAHGVKRIRAREDASGIIAGLQTACPDIFEGKAGSSEPRSISNWRFVKPKK